MSTNPTQPIENDHPQAQRDVAQKPSPPDELKQLDDTDIGARLVYQKIWRPCNVENQHFMAGIVGAEGSGKSGTALSICETVDPGFTADRVFFDPANFMEWCDADERTAGDAAIIDEAGVGLGNRTWHDEDQILLNKALQTARDDNLAVFFTLPRLSELDSQTRGRLRTFIECVDLKEGQYVEVKWKNYVPSRDEDNYVIKPYPRLKVNHREQRITRVKISPPGQDLWDRYNERKAEFKSELYEETVESLRSEEGGAGNNGPDLDAIADEIATKRLDEFIRDNNGQRYIDRSKIKREYDEVGESRSKEIKAILQDEWEIDAI